MHRGLLYNIVSWICVIPKYIQYLITPVVLVLLMTTGLSMYDVHTEEGWVWLRWTYATVRTGGGSATAYKWTSTQKTRALSSHAKKLAFFWTRISSISRPTVLNKSQWYYRRIFRKIIVLAVSREWRVGLLHVDGVWSPARVKVSLISCWQGSRGSKMTFWWTS